MIYDHVFLINRLTFCRHYDSLTQIELKKAFLSNRFFVHVAQ